ncbi:hypothetical protein ACFVAV_01080 [Nocardia sp. NPDC057663]|uniref:hypothetical protein n=1 Tax=Nocardia sp. NPDC057663 TaxID=3346201 RepID=UPI00366BCD48
MHSAHNHPDAGAIIENSSILEVVEIQSAPSAQAVCVVRCLSGTVEVGDIATSGVMHDGNRISLSLEVSVMLRYGMRCDLLDPPHSALLRLSGVVPNQFVNASRLFLTRAGSMPEK